MSRHPRVCLAAVLTAALTAALSPVVVGPTAVADQPVGDRRTSQTAPAAERRDTFTVTGRVVRFGSGRPVRGVRVSAYDAGETELVGSDLTDADGRFVMRGVEAGDNEFGIFVRGARVGLQNGWLDCDRTLVPSFGDACTVSTPVGKIRIKAA